MQDLLERSRRRFRVPAIGAATIRNGAVTVGVAGVRRRGSSDAAGPGDHWHIGSCAKAMTAALYATLVEDGEAAWGTPVARLFPDLDGVDPGWAAVTIDDLLRCRAGTPANLSTEAMRSAYRDEDPADLQRLRIVVETLARPPRRPGRFRYSNLGYVVAGAAVERIAGAPFEQVIRRRLFDPLEMYSAGVGPPPDLCGHGPRLRLPGLVLGRGGAQPPDSARSDNPSVLTPAGRIHLTLADWARFVTVFLEPGFFGAGTTERLTRLAAGGRFAMGWGPGARLGGSAAMQGSNTMWSATVVVDIPGRAASMVVTNDGRTTVLARTARVAATLLRAA